MRWSSTLQSQLIVGKEKEDGRGGQSICICMLPYVQSQNSTDCVFGVLVDDILAKSNNIFGLILLGTLERLQYRVTPCQDRLAATY